ncbi:hypothetical protein [Bradyrhizobium sp. OK095]|uniref:hypothetical protein n=1 Tax=Bradyrhizobium sp. OK095 TaxID=1882760 RepID=UPI0008B20E59|nr:hypothetical protein [Bradyrhizobium sp. OK095]SEM27563.1 hypothetical protein SAMN05443254_101534 [Bradyrhizobium sp. OK095]
MRTFIVGDETKLKALSEKLLLANLSQVRSEAALKALQEANPHADLNKLARGTVLFVPDAPGFKVSTTNSATEGPLAALQDLLDQALRLALEETSAGNSARLADQDQTVKAFDDGAVKKAISDPTIGPQIREGVDAVRKGFEVDRELAARAEKNITDVGRAAIAKLNELGKTFG